MPPAASPSAKGSNDEDFGAFGHVDEVGGGCPFRGATL